MTNRPDYDAPARTNFQNTVEYLSPIVPRLRLSLSEYALEQHLSLNLSRAGYKHLSKDRYGIYWDHSHHEPIRGFVDPGYVISSRAKSVFAGTSSVPVPTVQSLNTESPLNRTIAPRPKSPSLGEDCPLCKKSFHKHSRVVILPCTHILHYECAKDWFIICADWCPVCEYFYRHLRFPTHPCVIESWTR